MLALLHFAKRFYDPPLISFSAASSLGRAGIAPFWVVVIAPHAFANFSTSLNLGSSCNQKVKISQSLFKKDLYKYLL